MPPPSAGAFRLRSPGPRLLPNDARGSRRTSPAAVQRDRRVPPQDPYRPDDPPGAAGLPPLAAQIRAVLLAWAGLLGTPRRVLPGRDPAARRPRLRRPPGVLDQLLGLRRTRWRPLDGPRRERLDRVLH